MASKSNGPEPVAFWPIARSTREVEIVRVEGEGPGTSHLMLSVPPHVTDPEGVLVQVAHAVCKFLHDRNVARQQRALADSRRARTKPPSGEG